MLLPDDKSPINQSVIGYLTELLTGSNPEQLRSVAFFFDSQPTRVFNKPGANTEDLGTADTRIPEGVTARLQRFDSVQSVVYQQNPTCQWQIVNGRLRLVCG